MKKNFESLLRGGKIKPIKSSPKEIGEILSLADRDIKMAEFVLSQDWDWAFSIAYNASLQAARAYMYSKGYRASSSQGHKNTFEFMRIAFGSKYKDLVDFLDRMRPKRNRAVYDVSGMITETEVKELLTKTREFLQIIKGEIKA